MTPEERSFAVITEQARLIREHVTGYPYLEYKGIDVDLMKAVAAAIREAMAEDFESKANELELRAARHGATQARREVIAYLRHIGQPVTAMGVEKRCRWPDTVTPAAEA
jgi:hypothetical protein